MDVFQPITPTVLIFASTSVHVEPIASILAKYYAVKIVYLASEVLRLCAQEQPDLVLIDSINNQTAGIEMSLGLKFDLLTKHIPIIFLTSEDDLLFQQKLNNVGAVDYITRPMHSTTLISRIKAHLAYAANKPSQRLQHEFLEYEANRHKLELNTLQEVTLLALASLAEIRDVETGNHLKRTQHYILALGKHLMPHPRFADYLDDRSLEILFKCAPLHDIGKVGIPDRILLKPGRYEAAEFEIMKAHPRLGRDAILNAQSLAGDHSAFLETAKEIVYSHHEKWDGSGYPEGLVGDAIPIAARLMAIADVYDALISRRVYKEGMAHAQAAKIIVDGKGKHFDPDVVDAFLALEDVFQEVAARFADSDLELQKKADLIALAL